MRRREHQLIRVFPTETAGDLWFERYILRGIPLIQKRVFHEGLIKPEGKIAEYGHFIPGIGVFQVDGATVAGGKKGDKDKGRQDGCVAGSVTHKGGVIRVRCNTLLIYKNTIKKPALCLRAKKERWKLVWITREEGMFAYRGK